MKTYLSYSKTYPVKMETLATNYFYASIYGNNIYGCKTGNQAAKSTDYGTTWTDFTKVFDTMLTSCFASKDGILYVSEYELLGVGSKIWRSADDGANWTNVFTTTVGGINTWAWAQNSAGVLFAGEYSNSGINSCYLWKSINDGVNWTRIDLTAYGLNHIHQVFVDPVSDYLYVSFGDDAVCKIYRSIDDGVNWTQLFAGVNRRYTGITSTNDARFFADDLTGSINHIWKSINDVDLIDSYFPSSNYNTEWADIVSIDGEQTIFSMFNNYARTTGKYSIISMSQDDGVTWKMLIYSQTSATSYRFMRPVMDYRHRIPSGFPYLIVNDFELYRLVRILISDAKE